MCPYGTDGANAHVSSLTDLTCLASCLLPRALSATLLSILRGSPSLFPGRLAASRARQLLLSVGGDVDIALAVLMDEDAES